MIRESASIGLAVEQLEALWSRFPARDVSLWQDVEWLAKRFWDSRCDQITAHHLVMAVGNFKRQGGTIIRTRPFPHEDQPEKSAQVGDKCTVFGIPLERQGDESWKGLCGDTKGGIPGIGVATATTLLSALWPGDHIIMDIRALGALIGVRGVSGNSWYTRRVRDDSEPRKSLGSIDWNDYAWYRDIVLAQSRAIDAEPLSVERALFVLDEEYSVRHGRRDKSPRSWKQYGQELRTIADSGSPMGS